MCVCGGVTPKPPTPGQQKLIFRVFNYTAKHIARCAQLLKIKDALLPGSAHVEDGARTYFYCMCLGLSTCLHVCVCIRCMPGAHGQRGTWVTPNWGYRLL